jgi:hypothetical protein
MHGNAAQRVPVRRKLSGGRKFVDALVDVVLTAGLASFCRSVEKTGFFPWKNRPGKNSFCRAEKTTRQKPGKISFANICQVEKKDF